MELKRSAHADFHTGIGTEQRHQGRAHLSAVQTMLAAGLELRPGDIWPLTPKGLVNITGTTSDTLLVAGLNSSVIFCQRDGLAKGRNARLRSVLVQFGLPPGLELHVDC